MLRLDLCHLCLLVINFSFIFLTKRRKETNKYELSCPHKACRMHIEKEKKKNEKIKEKKTRKKKWGFMILSLSCIKNLFIYIQLPWVADPSFN